MKKFRVLMLIGAMVMALASVGVAMAQNAYGVPIVTSITFQNVTNEDATLTIQVYGNSGTPVKETVLTVPAGSGNSVYMGNLVDGSLTGSAVLSSDKEILATAVQIPQSTTVKNRPLSNGFKSGSGQVLLATILKNQFNTTSQFAIQNAGTNNTDVEVKFYKVGETTPAATVTENNIPPGVSKYFDAGQLAQLPNPFNGSATVTASSGGSIVGSVIEAQTNNVGIRAFEGVTEGAKTVYMATALCEAFGTTTFYAVQNTGTSNANVTVTYSNGGTDNAIIVPGGKKSFSACNATGVSAGFSGAAKITSDQDIVVIGKVGGSGRYTAFLGENGGGDKLALPYVRWSETQFNTGKRQRVFIAIQNIGDAAVNGVIVKYLDKNGTVIGTHSLASIAAGGKANSKAIDATGDAAKLAEFGTPDANPGGGYGGSVIIEGPAGSKLVAIARVASKVAASGATVAEDYNAVAIE
jgi:hypothetical protein